MKFYALLTAAILVLPISAHALIRLDLEVDKAPLAFLIDPHKTVQLEGLPFLGLHLYSISADTLFIQHPDEPTWLALPLGNVTQNLPVAHLEKGNESGQFLKTPNRHWAIRIGARICDHVFTNVEASQRTGLNITHLTHISAGLNYIYGQNQGGKKQDSCANYAIPPVLGKLVGLPIHASGSGGQMDVKRLTRLPGQGLPHPETTELFNTAAHIRFLQRQLPPQAAATFAKTSQKLPLQQQLRALKHLHQQNLAPASRPARQN